MIRAGKDAECEGRSEPLQHRVPRFAVQILDDVRPASVPHRHCYITNMSATALATDLYQLTMMAGYFKAGRHQSTRATFDLFVRRLPPRRSFLVAAGIEQALSFLETLRFDAPDVAW